MSIGSRKGSIAMAFLALASVIVWGAAPSHPIRLRVDSRTIYVHAVNRALDSDFEAEVDLTALKLSEGKAVLHMLEAVPGKEFPERKARMAERRQPVAVSNGKVSVVFPRRTVSILEVREDTKR